MPGARSTTQTYDGEASIYETEEGLSRGLVIYFAEEMDEPLDGEPLNHSSRVGLTSHPGGW